MMSSKHKDLSLVLYYGEHPVRVGNYAGEVIFSVNDLLKALGLKWTNTTNIMRGVPEELFFRASSIDLSGICTNTTVTAVTLRGSRLVLPRVRKVDLYDTMQLMDWMETVKAEKIKGA